MRTERTRKEHAVAPCYAVSCSIWCIATRVNSYFSAEHLFRAPATDTIQEKKNKALNTTDADLAVRLWWDIADELFYDVHTIPLFILPVQAVIDPEVISEYVFLGASDGWYSNLENIKAVRQ